MIPGSESASETCQRTRIPLWLVLLDNIPTLLLFMLGFLILDRVSTAAAIAYALYAAGSVVWFWAKICPYCHHYGTLACPCGYGIVSSRLFRRQNTLQFRKVFRRNLPVVFPNWFVPAGVAVYLLATDFSGEILVLTLLFSFIGFILIPVISRLVGCRNCEIKENCPWMTVNRKPGC